MLKSGTNFIGQMLIKINVMSGKMSVESNRAKHHITGKAHEILFHVIVLNSLNNLNN